MSVPVAERAFLSSLGTMGNRHLQGLLRAGCHVTGFDPSVESAKKTIEMIKSSNLPLDQFRWVEAFPKEDFDLAVFSETTKFRYENFKTFLERSKCPKMLLEKPLSSNGEELNKIAEVVHDSGIEHIHVNLIRRTRPFYHTLRQLCQESKQVTVTLNGGAAGIGCNGIHFIDLFEFLLPTHKTEVVYSHLCENPVESGRGKEFRDFGGTFVLKKGEHFFQASLSSDSSATTALTVRGDHFLAWVDESNFNYRLRIRQSSSKKPNYLYGQDYETHEEGVVKLLTHDEITEKWVTNPNFLPTFQEGLVAHNLIFEILKKGGALGPYCFT